MGFFDDIPRPPPPPKPVRESWMGPPPSVLPGAAGVELLLGLSPKVAVMLGPLLVWPEGFHLSLWACARDPEDYLDAHRPHMPRPGEPWPPPEAMRFGVEYSDGRRATTFGVIGRPPADDAPAIRLTPQGSRGGQSTHSWEYWVWPLPPAGRVTFACEWPAQDLQETLTELDAAVLHEAASRAQAVWDD